MRLGRDEMRELMAFADGELEGEARERAARLVAQSEEAARLVETLQSPALARALADVMDERVAAGAADGIADAVMAKLGATSAGASVVRIEDARPARTRRTRVQVAIASSLTALALAAGVALYVQASREPEAASPVASMGIPSQTAKPLATAVLAEQQGVQVDEIDSPRHDVHVFEIPAGSAAAAAANPPHPSSVVIMIEDDPGGAP